MNSRILCIAALRKEKDLILVSSDGSRRIPFPEESCRSAGVSLADFCYLTLQFGAATNVEPANIPAPFTFAVEGDKAVTTVNNAVLRRLDDGQLYFMTLNCGDVACLEKFSEQDADRNIGSKFTIKVSLLTDEEKKTSLSRFAWCARIQHGFSETMGGPPNMPASPGFFGPPHPMYQHPMQQQMMPRPPAHTLSPTNVPDRSPASPRDVEMPGPTHTLSPTNVPDRSPASPRDVENKRALVVWKTVNTKKANETLHYLWLLDDHKDSLFSFPKESVVGHCFEGTFEKSKKNENQWNCRCYNHAITEKLFSACRLNDKKKLEIDVEVDRVTQKTGLQYAETYHKCFGEILDTEDLLPTRIDEPLLITIMRLYVKTVDGHRWCVVNVPSLEGKKEEPARTSRYKALPDSDSKIRIFRIYSE